MSRAFRSTGLKTLIGITWLVCIGFKEISLSTVVVVAFSIELLIFVTFSSKKVLNFCAISASVPQPTGSFSVVLTPISILKLLYFFLRSTFRLTCSSKKSVFFRLNISLHLLIAARNFSLLWLSGFFLYFFSSFLLSLFKSWSSLSKKGQIANLELRLSIGMASFAAKSIESTRSSAAVSTQVRCPSRSKDNSTSFASLFISAFFHALKTVCFTLFEETTSLKRQNLMRSWSL